MTGSGLSGRGLTVLLGAITALTPAAMDIYLVSMPSLTEAFGASTTAVQMTIAVYLLGNAVGQLFWGSLSDRFGRRPVLLSGLALFGVAAVACAAAPSIEMLIAARLVQGVGISAGLVITRAIVRDCYDGDRAASVLALMSMITGIAPLLAPIVGSALQSAFGWRAIFVCIALCAAIVFASALLLLEETLAEPDGEATRPSIMLRNFSQMLSNATFVGNAIVVCAVTGGLIAFLASSSFVFVRSLGYAEQNFGFVFGLTMVGNIVGASFGRHLVGLLGIERTISAEIGRAHV